MKKGATFGVWVRARRRALGLTQAELAERVHCAEISIRKIEADQMRPSRDMAEKITRALGTEGLEQSALILVARRVVAAKGRK